MRVAPFLVLAFCLGPGGLPGCAASNESNPSTGGGGTGAGGSSSSGGAGAGTDASELDVAAPTPSGDDAVAPNDAPGADESSTPPAGDDASGGTPEAATPGDDGGGGDAGPPVVDAGSPLPLPDGAPPGAVSLFDGTTLNGWSGPAGTWSVVAGAIDGKSNTTGKSPVQFIYTDGNYSDFRLDLDERMVVSGDHLGVCMFGNRPPAGSGSADKCILVIPPDGSMWDYGRGGIHGAKVGNAGVSQAAWHHVEIVAHRSTGVILMAVNGVQVTKYQDANPARLQNGPIGLQLHAWAGPQEAQYKNVYVVVNPANPGL